MTKISFDTSEDSMLDGGIPPLPLLDLDLIDPHSKILAIGKRHSGKSVLARELMRRNPSSVANRVVIASYNESRVGVGDDPHFSKQYMDWHSFLFTGGTTQAPFENRDHHHPSTEEGGWSPPSTTLTHRYDPVIIDEFVKQQKVGGDGVIVIDDCIFQNITITVHAALLNLLKERELKARVVITMSYPVSVPAVGKANLDYIFLFCHDMAASRRRMFDEYAKQAFPSFELFNETMDKVARQKGWPGAALVIRCSDMKHFFVC